MQTQKHATYRVELRYGFLTATQREIKEAFLPLLRRIFYDSLPSSVKRCEITDGETTCGETTWNFQELHYFFSQTNIPNALRETYLAHIFTGDIFIVELIFREDDPESPVKSIRSPHAEFVFWEEEIRLPERKFNPTDFLVSPQEELALARPDENDALANSLSEIANDVNPKLRIFDVNKFFNNRFQWLREILIPCERAIEIMLNGIRGSLGLEGYDAEPPEHWEALGHTLFTCWERSCLNFRHDWQTIIHLDKYYTWQELYRNHQATFHKWGITLK